MRTLTRTALRCSLAGLAAAAAVLVRSVPVHGLDPNLHHHIVVGAPDAPAALRGIDLGRSHSTAWPLPRIPNVKWRALAPGPLDAAVAVDRSGRVIAATEEPRLFQLAADGTLEWSVRLAGKALGGPVLLSDGTRAVVTRDGVLAIDDRGNERWRFSLAGGENLEIAPPLPTADGGLVLGAGRELVHLTPFGTLHASAVVPREITEIVSDGDHMWALDRAGTVWSWKTTGLLDDRGSLRGTPNRGALLLGGSLYAVVDSQLVAVDLSTRARRVLATVGDVISPLARFRDGVGYVAANGELVALDRAGRETSRVVLWSAGTSTAPRITAFLLVGTDGSAAVSAYGRGVGFLGRLGEVRWLETPRCTDSVFIAPRRPSELLVGCHSGLVLLVGNQPASAP